MKKGDWVRVIKPYDGRLKVGDTYFVENVTSGITIRLNYQNVYFSKDYFELIEESKPVKFEVGKKYKSDADVIHHYLCVHVLETGVPILQSTSNPDQICHPKKAAWGYWTEYKEPVTHTKYVHVWKNSKGEIRFGSPVAERIDDPMVVATHKIKYTEE